jgi:hypothetical protein
LFGVVALVLEAGGPTKDAIVDVSCLCLLNLVSNISYIKIWWRHGAGHSEDFLLIHAFELGIGDGWGR